MNSGIPDDEIFHAALEVENEDQQNELIESLCADDAQQLQRVRSLMDSHRKMADQKSGVPSILDRPGFVFRSFSDVSELVPGKRIGNYVLTKLIGEGSTSLVFLAKQLAPVERDVALKSLKPGMDSQRILARFGLEHHVINQLEHPGITSVYDVGIQDNGRPFIAMELVPNAMTISQYASQFELDVRRRIQLMIETCEIVQHAHQRGVIHRDLKPSNILLEGVAQSQPKPRIIDFGIAKIIQPCEGFRNVTTMGDRLGTPAYMSPEQALMPTSSVDIRSDVYSLGAILYELLTGTTPREASRTSATHLNWTSNAYWEYELKAPSRVNKQPGKPWTHLPFLKKLVQVHRHRQTELASSGTSHELDRIILKSLAKDRQDRYQTVADLQRDMQRFLRGEPVEAAGIGLAYRVKKMVMRNRAISIAAAVTLLTIFTTSIMTISYALRMHDAQKLVKLQLQNTLDAQKKLLLERDRAEEAMRQSQSILRAFQVQWVTHRCLSRFLNQALDDAQREPFNKQAASELTSSVNLEALAKPHERLVVKGDWKWATSTFPIELVHSTFQISSSEASQALPIVQGPLPSAQPIEAPPAQEVPPSPNSIQNDFQTSDQLESTAGAKSRFGKDRQTFQDILLEELRSILPSNDPFIAEVLDNCGLLALDRNSPAEAARLLGESARIWGQSNKYFAHWAQSQLFLAEAHLRNNQFDDCCSVLADAEKSLAKIPLEHPQLSSLHNLMKEIQMEWKTRK